MKTLYLCVDDYGSGGTWYLVSAESPNDIQSRLPFLTIVQSRPEWMDEERYQRIANKRHFDIDTLPTTGLLGTMLSERLKNFEGKPSNLSKEEAADLINSLISGKHRE